MCKTSATCFLNEIVPIALSTQCHVCSGLSLCAFLSRIEQFVIGLIGNDCTVLTLASPYQWRVERSNLLVHKFVSAHLASNERFLHVFIFLRVLRFKEMSQLKANVDVLWMMVLWIKDRFSCTATKYNVVMLLRNWCNQLFQNWSVFHPLCQGLFEACSSSVLPICAVLKSFCSVWKDKILSYNLNFILEIQGAQKCSVGCFVVSDTFRFPPPPPPPPRRRGYWWGH